MRYRFYSLYSSHPLHLNHTLLPLHQWPHQNNKGSDNPIQNYHMCRWGIDWYRFDFLLDIVLLSASHFLPLHLIRYFFDCLHFPDDQSDYRFRDLLAFPLRLLPQRSLPGLHQRQSIFVKRPALPTLHYRNRRCSNTSSKFLLCYTSSRFRSLRKVPLLFDQRFGQVSSTHFLQVAVWSYFRHHRMFLRIKPFSPLLWQSLWYQIHGVGKNFGLLLKLPHLVYEGKSLVIRHMFLFVHKVFLLLHSFYHK